MKFSINQVIEVIDGVPKIISQELRALGEQAHLLSLAKDYIEGKEDLEFVQRDQYCGYRDGKRYKIVLMERQDKLIIAHTEHDIFSSPSKLFPYLVETDITSVEELHQFFAAYYYAL